MIVGWWFCLLLACAEKNPDSATQQATPHQLPQTPTTHLFSNKMGIEFDFPKHWKAVRSPGKDNVITLQEPLHIGKDPYQENILIWSEQLPMQISDSLYAQTVVAELKITNPKFTVTNLPARIIAGKKFYSYHFQFTPADSNVYEVHGFTYYHAADSTGYNFNVTTQQTQTNSFLPQAIQVIESFKTR